VLNLIPIFTAEAGSGLRATVKISSLPDIKDAFAYIGPTAAIEYNYYIMYAPYHVVSTFSGGVFTGADGHVGEQGGLPHPPATDEEWDEFFRRLLLEFGTDGNEFYGANPDGTGATYDPVRNMYVRHRGTVNAQADQVSSSSSLSSDDQDVINRDNLTAQGEADEPLTYGPRGIARLYSRETILKSESSVTLGRSVSGLSGIFSQAGINDLVYGDEFEIDIPVPVSGPGYILMGVVRMEVSDTVGHSSSYRTEQDDHDAMARNRALNILFGGDTSRAEWLIRNGTGVTGDYLRSMLFGGDNYLEDAGTYTPIDFFDDGGWFRKNTILVNQKVFVGMHSPYVMDANV
jgi:hypothetical protein